MKKPLPQPLDVALKAHYQSKSLSPEQSDRLLALQTTFVQQQQESAAAKVSTRTNEPAAEGFISRIIRFISPAKVGSGSYRYAFHLAAALLCVILLAFTFKLPNHSGPSLSQRIMDEIAYNHLQKMPIEVASASLDDIRSYLDKLTFPLISPSALEQPNWQLLGGRYCSINGRIAAQLKVKNLTDDNVYTLYQATIDGQLESIVGDAPTTKMIDGVGVSIWQEKGLLLGLASSP